MTEEINVIYQFWYEPKADTVEQGITAVEPLVQQCHDFAGSLDILCMTDHAGAFDGKFHLRIQFNLRAAQYIVLHKVTALFAFAAAHQLLFRNQFCLSEQKRHRWLCHLPTVCTHYLV